MSTVSVRPARRWPGLLLAVVGLLGVAGWWVAPSVVQAVGLFLHANWQDRNNISGVISMITGLITLLVTVVLGLLQGRRTSWSEKDTPPQARRDEAARDRLQAPSEPAQRLVADGRPGHQADGVAGSPRDRTHRPPAATVAAGGDRVAAAATGPAAGPV